MALSQGIDETDDNPYYSASTDLDPISHFELARASKAVPGAVKQHDSPQSYLPSKELAEWACSSSAASRSIPAATPTRGAYTALTGPDEIRVLEIRPGVDREPIRCALHHCSVEFDGSHSDPDASGLITHHSAQFATSITSADPIWYTALSYRWGDPTVKGAPVEVLGDDKGHQVQVTKSLEEILFHVRSRDYSVVMWIDQICINQEDNEDKARQIPLMSKIYGRALNTLVWLTPSPASPVGVDPFALFNDLALKLQFIEDTISPADFTRIGLPGPDSESWAQVWYVLSQEYFQRLWIIQEIALSARPRLACGGHLLSWTVFSNACYRLHGSGASRWLMGKFSSASCRGRAGAEEVEADVGLSLPRPDVCSAVMGLDSIAHSPAGRRHRLLEVARSAQSWDARDKIYGMLGLDSSLEASLGPDLLRWEVDVSYQKEDTAAELYRKIAVQSLTKQNGPLVTLLVNVDHYRSMPGLPSWVPDWSRPRRTVSIGTGLDMAGFYQASPVRRSECAFGAGDRELHVHGQVVDSISRFTAVLRNPDMAWQDPAANNATLLACHRLAKTLETYPGLPFESDTTAATTATTVFEAFWRTLVADKDAAPGLHREQMSRARAPHAAFAEVFSLLLDAATGAAADGDLETPTPSLPGQTYSRRQRLPQGSRGRLVPESLSSAEGRGSKGAAAAFKAARVAMWAALVNRRVGVTERGYLGAFPDSVQRGDVVCVLRGCHVPFVLRPVGEGEGAGRFEVLGECYVHGMMNGEAVRAGEDEKMVLL